MILPENLWNENLKKRKKEKIKSMFMGKKTTVRFFKFLQKNYYINFSFLTLLKILKYC